MLLRGGRRAVIAPLILLMVILLVSGCARRPKQERVLEKTSLLPPSAAGEKNFSSYQPHSPFTPAAGSLLTRKIFETDAGAGYHIQVLDWKLPPAKQSESTPLSGGAFCDVRSGTGALTVGDQKRELKLGATFSIDQGRAFTIANTGNSPLNMRLYLVTAR
jgi:hypothetical protein